MGSRCFAAISILTILVQGAHVGLGKQADHGIILSLCHDLGEIREEQTYTHTFVIQNTFGGKFTVARVEKSCGCADVVLSKQEIPAGKSMEAMVKITITGRAYGPWKQNVLIFDDSDKPRIIKLELSGKFPKDGRLIATPDTISLGKIAKSEVIERVFQIRRRDHSAVLFESTETSADSIEVRLLPKSAVDEGTLAFVVKISPLSTMVGELNEWIRIKTKHPKYKNERINVSGQVVGDVYSVPKRLFLGQISGDKAANWVVYLKSYSGRKLGVTNSTHTLGEDWDVVTDGSEVRVHYVSNGKTDSDKFIRGQIKITVNYEDVKQSECLEVPVIGMIKAELSHLPSRQLSDKENNV